MSSDGLHRDLTHAIIGSAFEVLKVVGHGLHEKPYENALMVELGLRGLVATQQRKFPVYYKGVKIGEYVPDLLVNDVVIVDTKTVDRITAVETGQMLNYLKITQLSVGLILNFKRPKLEYYRVVL